MQWRARQNKVRDREQKAKWGLLYVVDKVTTQSHQRHKHTHSHTDRHAQIYTHAHLATNEVGQVTEVSMDEGNRQRGGGRLAHTEFS